MVVRRGVKEMLQFVEM